jgi:raffinose/stachyose/melibiose transport system permease protein
MVVPVGLGLALALLLARSPLRGGVFFRMIYFIPQVLSSIAIAVVWSWIYNPTYGALNQLLGALGLESLQRGWLGDANLALPALFIVWTWIFYGFTMVIFLAALEGIDEVLFEAAKIDGAVWHQQMRHVLLPAIRLPLTTILLITAISAFQVFDIIFALTNGGPGRATIVLPLYMLDSAFTFRRIGYGATVAVALGGMILIFSLGLLRLRSAFRDEVQGG